LDGTWLIDSRREQNRVAPSAERQLAGFIALYTPEIQRIAKDAAVKLESCLPGANRLVYDNYNALVIGFGPTERTSDAILSLVLYPRWVTLYFLQGAGLPDPDGLLQGSGKVGRHVVLTSAHDLVRPAVRALIRAAVLDSDVPFDKRATGRIIIKSVSSTARPRRPPRPQERPTTAGVKRQRPS
jgi:hypothetical protein